MTLTYLYDMIHVISSPKCGSIRYLSQLNYKGRYFKMDDGDSTDTTCMCNALTVVRAFHYIS